MYSSRFTKFKPDFAETNSLSRNFVPRFKVCLLGKSSGKSAVALPSIFEQKRDRPIEALTIPTRSLAAQPQRVIGFTRSNERWAERSETQGPFSNFSDFYARGVNQIDTDVRVYEIAGHDVQVVIPERYAVQLESSEPEVSDRLDVQHWPALLDSMPDSKYFARICMSDKRNPEDAWVGQEYKSSFVSAMSMVDGELTTYMTERARKLRRDVLHEWSHQLRYEFWDTKITDCFSAAVELETDWKPSSYAGRSKGEQWAVLGERMLGVDGEEFLEAVEKAPIRAAVWMIALKKCLDNVERKSLDHSFYAARQSFVSEEILPAAILKLNNFVEHGTEEQIKLAREALKSLDLINQK